MTLNILFKIQCISFAAFSTDSVAEIESLKKPPFESAQAMYYYVLKHTSLSYRLHKVMKILIFVILLLLLFRIWSQSLNLILISNVKQNQIRNNRIFYLKLLMKYKLSYESTMKDENIHVLASSGFVFTKSISDESKHINRSTASSKCNYSEFTSKMISINPNKLWFMKEGYIRPKPSSSHCVPIWPHQDRGDRIIEQLMYMPEKRSSKIMNVIYNTSMDSLVFSKYEKLKRIYLYFGKNGWNNLVIDRATFIRQNCPVNSCTITINPEDAEAADAIIFREKFRKPPFKRRIDQVWIFYLLECPLNSPPFKNLEHVINWTATYRHDSDIVTPYEKFVPYNVSLLKHSTKEKILQLKQKNFALNKKKMVAWFVSNCFAKNDRFQYATELSYYIDVDIYGACGMKVCSKGNNQKCFDMLDKEYKFYLSFENGNCKDYITEKFFVNGLK